MPTRLIKSIFKQQPSWDVFSEMALQRLQTRVDVLQEERRGLFSLAGDQFSGVALKFSGDLADADAPVVLEHASSSVSTWLGATPAALTREPLLALEPLSPAIAQRLKRQWLVSRKRLQPFSQLLSLESRSGDLRWLHVQVMPSRQSSRLVWECLALDVTALQNVRESQEKALREQLIFLSSLNARLRTPLNAIAGYAQLMQQSTNDQTKAHVSDTRPHGSTDLGEIGKSCDQVTEILDEVLDTTALALGTVQLAEDEVAFGPWLQDLAGSWRHLAEDRALAFSLELSNCQHVVLTDRKRLGQVLRRLFLTTIDAARPSQLLLKVACQHQADRLHATVAMTLANPTSEPGVTAARVLNRSDDILALSSPLAWAQQMARRLGGSVGHALNADGSFTLQLRINLPLVQAALLPVIEHSSPQEGLTILVVDDSMTNRLILKRFLESRGHTVQEADNGAVAVAAVSQAVPDLVFMDIDMPEMDGCDATRAIRGLEGEAAAVPVCAMTGLSFDQDRERAQASGMNHFITKPVNFREVQRICALMSRQPQQKIPNA